MPADTPHRPAVNEVGFWIPWWSSTALLFGLVGLVVVVTFVFVLRMRNPVAFLIYSFLLSIVCYQSIVLSVRLVANVDFEDGNFRLDAAAIADAGQISLPVLIFFGVGLLSLVAAGIWCRSPYPSAEEGRVPPVPSDEDALKSVVKTYVGWPHLRGEVERMVSHPENRDRFQFARWRWVLILQFRKKRIRKSLASYAEQIQVRLMRIVADFPADAQTLAKRLRRYIRSDLARSPEFSQNLKREAERLGQKAADEGRGVDNG